MILTPYELATGNLLCKLQIFPFYGGTYIYIFPSKLAGITTTENSYADGPKPSG
jgi:hypothetical protein